MKAFSLEVEEFTITREKAKLKLSEPLTEKNSKDIWALFLTSSVREFEITHSENIDFKAVFYGEINSAAIVAGIPELVVDIVRPA